MKKENPNLEDTQEIKLPNSDKRYGDDFEDACSATSSEKTSKLKNLDKLQIILVSMITIIIIIIICIIFFKVTPSQNTASNFKNINSATSSSETKSQTTSITTEPNIIIQPTEVEIITEAKTEPETEIETELETISIPTEEIETTLITEPSTVFKEDSSTLTNSSTPTAPTNITEPTNMDIQKNISVSDISVTNSGTNTFTATVSGEFTGYSAEELLTMITVNTSTGSPQISLPYIENNNLITFNLNLEGCEGELHIHLDNFDFYQDISSFSN